MPPSPPTNRLLDALAPDYSAKLIAASVHVELPIRNQVYASEEVPKYVYFLTSGVVSTVFTSERGTSIEIATTGNEGMLGWMHLLGGQVSPLECMTQSAGSAYRMPFSVAQREFETNEAFRKTVLEFVQHECMLASQLVACNRLHRAEARFARWLLMVQDRLHSDTLVMTQEFLSNMLGTRRTTVVEVSAALRRAAAIESRRGVVRIQDRAKLEEFACECYRPIKAMLDALYQAPG